MPERCWNKGHSRCGFGKAVGQQINEAHLMAQDLSERQVLRPSPDPVTQKIWELQPSGQSSL